MAGVTTGKEPPLVMRNRLAIAAAVAAVLTVSACGAAPWPTLSGSQHAPGAGPASESTTGHSDFRIDILGAGAAGDPGEPGLPAGSGASIDDVLRLGAVAAWVDAPTALAISVPADDRCRPRASEPTLVTPTRISIEIAVESVCEAPSSARTYTVQVPAGADPSAGLEIELDGLPEPVTLTLPAT